jgi:protein gp37
VLCGQGRTPDGRQSHAKVAAANRGLAYRQASGVLNWTGAVRLLPERLALPFAWPAPRKVFVNSLSDQFHERVPLPFVIRAFAVVAATPWHTDQVPTKRAERLAEPAPYLDWPANV